MFGAIAILTTVIVWHLSPSLTGLDTSHDLFRQILQKQKYEQEENVLLAQIERERLRYLGWTSDDYAKAERIVGMPAGALPRSRAEYFGRLEDLTTKWFGGAPAHQSILSALHMYKRMSVEGGEPVRTTLFTMNQDGRQGVPQGFHHWEDILGAGQPAGQGDGWIVDVINDRSDMDELLYRYADGVVHDQEVSDNSTTFTEDHRLRDLWDQLDFAVLKTDLLRFVLALDAPSAVPESSSLTVRYLVLMFEGGLYADSDTEPLAHPTRWGSLSTLVPTESHPLLLQLAQWREQHGWASSGIEGDAAAARSTRDSRYHDIANRDTILDPGVSIVLSLDGDNVHSRLEGGIADPDVDVPYVGYPGVAYRHYEFCQWTLLAKRLHPLFIDAAITALENVEWALAERKLDGTVPVLTGPGPFTDAVLRYLLIERGLDPVTFIQLQKRQPDSAPSMRIGDIVVYRPYSFGVRSFQPEHADIGLKENIHRPVAHGYRGSWQEQGWD